MEGSAVNSSSSSSQYFWAECDAYDDTDRPGRPSAGLIILYISSCFELITGAPSNLWLICIILRQRSKVAGMLPADFFQLHLALSHICFYLVLPIFFINNFLWRSNNVLTVLTFLNSMVLVMKPLLLCLVCVERYLAVVRPLNYVRFKAPKYRWGYVSVSWCIYIIVAYTSLAHRSSATLSVILFPVLVIDTFCSISILKALKKPPPGDREVMKRKKREEEGESQRSRVKEGRREENVKKDKPTGNGKMNSMKKKAFITIATIQAVLTLNYLPILFTLPMDGRVPARTLKCQYMTIGLAAAYSCSYLQPLLYLHRLGPLPCARSKNT